MTKRNRRARKVEVQVLEVLKQADRDLKSSEVAKLAGLPLQQVAPALKRLADQHIVRIREDQVVHKRSRVVTYKMFRWVGECQVGLLLRPFPREWPPGAARVVRGRDTRG